jgi:hypothetical protein
MERIYPETCSRPGSCFRIGLLQRLVNEKSRAGKDGDGEELAMVSSDVYDVYVIRKQLYISDEHERALKARAKELGISEAELVRRMLDGLLLDGEQGGRIAGVGATEALESFLEEADRLAESHRFPTGYLFSRDELYEDRT